MTPLHLAAERAHMDVVNYLVDEGADINMQDNKGVGYMTTTIPTYIGDELSWP